MKEDTSGKYTRADLCIMMLDFFQVKKFLFGMKLDPRKYTVKIGINRQGTRNCEKRTIRPRTSRWVDKNTVLFFPRGPQKVNEVSKFILGRDIYCYDRVDKRSLGKSYSTRYILARFWWKALVLVNPTVLEIFLSRFWWKSLVLVNPTVLDIF